MGSLDLTGVSGEGSHALSGTDFVVVKDIYVVLQSIVGKQRIVGTMEPKGVWQAGEVFVGYAASDTDPAIYSWGFFVHHSAEDQYVPAFQTGFHSWDTVFWRFNLGITADIHVYW